MIWLQIVTIVPMDGESIRRFAQVFLSSPEYNATSVGIISNNVDGLLPTAMYSLPIVEGTHPTTMHS